MTYCHPPYEPTFLHRDDRIATVGHLPIDAAPLPSARDTPLDIKSSLEYILTTNLKASEQIFISPVSHWKTRLSPRVSPAHTTDS